MSMRLHVPTYLDAEFIRMLMLRRRHNKITSILTKQGGT